MSSHPNFLGPMTLKALLEDPNLRNPPLVNPHGNQVKIKKEDDNGPKYNYGSAFLGPNLWDKSYIDLDFNLEYMDLDEFLNENGLPVNHAGEQGPEMATVGDPHSSNARINSPRQYINTPPHPSSPVGHNMVKPGSPSYPPQSPPYPIPNANKSPSPPISPFSVEFQVSDQDLALSSIPGLRPQWSSCEDGASRPPSGVNSFDPRKRNFSEEELKPQPIIKKSKKVFVPDELKDEKYWARRRKNNYAAKRSRDARRVKENQIALRAAFLEKENEVLREEMAKIKKENAKLKAKVNQMEGGKEFSQSLT